MRIRKLAASFLLACLISGASAQSRTEGKTEVLFHLSKKPVTTEEFVYLYRKNHQHKPEDFTHEKIEEYFNLFVNYKLKVEEALSRGMDTTTAFRKEYETYRQELLKPYMPDAKVVDSLVLLTYDRLREEVNASHILVRLDADASPGDTLAAFQKISEVRKKAINGEDFGTLAATYSEEPGAKVSRGNLGFFTAMQMVFPFEQAAYLTRVGSISEPVRTQFGYHIVKVLGRQPARGEVEVSHIMIRTQGEADDSARDRIFDVYDRLQKGMNWEELCSESSEDLNTRETGGKLRPFGVGAMASVPAFQDAAFALQNVGDISDPVHTQFGWHILKLESKIPLPPFSQLKPSLTQRVSRDERVRISSTALRARMRKEFGYRDHPGIVASVLANADAVLQDQYRSDSVLFSMGGRHYRVNDFLAYVRKNGGVTDGSPARQRLEKLLEQYTDQVQTSLLEERVIQSSPEYRWLVKEYYEGILLFEIMEYEVWNRAMEDSVGQRAFFASNSGKYQAGERMLGRIYQADSKAGIEGLMDLLTTDEREVRDFVSRNRIRLDSGTFEQNDRTILSKITWSPGTYLVENAGTHSLVVIDRMLPPGPQTFAEARASVISDYQTFLEDAWIRELRRKFAVKVAKRAKKRAFAQLIDSKAKQ